MNSAVQNYARALQLEVAASLQTVTCKHICTSK